MRLIEKEMLDAINKEKSWSKDNTCVSFNDNFCSITLYGHEIATVVNSKIVVNEKTLINYPTRTTMSRLRALGVSVNMKAGDVILNGEKLI